MESAQSSRPALTAPLCPGFRFSFCLFSVLTSLFYLFLFSVFSPPFSSLYMLFFSFGFSHFLFFSFSFFCSCYVFIFLLFSPRPSLPPLTLHFFLFNLFLFLTLCPCLSYSVSLFPSLDVFFPSLPYFAEKEQNQIMRRGKVPAH